MEVLHIENKPRQIIKTINIRLTKFFEHIVRHNTFITNIMEGKINGKEEENGRGKYEEAITSSKL